VSLCEHCHLLGAWFRHYANLTLDSKKGTLNLVGDIGNKFWNGNRFGDESALYSILGVSYKFMSKFAHDFGVIPYLFKEPAFFK
jgi:hypothetical protein